jgi:kynurenine formamidase
MPESDVLALFASCSNTGRWGPDDELGTLNFITPEVRLQAFSGVLLGLPVSIGKDLDTVLSLRNPHPVVHRMLPAPDDSWADVVEVASHGFATTHLDAISHAAFEGKLYNGRAVAEVIGPAGLRFGSIHAQRDGILTRGVLLDVAAARGVAWLAPDEGVYPEDLARAEDLAGTQVRRGDAVFVRVGLSAREAVEGPEDPATRAGLMPECLPWLFEREVALYGGDCIERLPLPYPRIPMPLHVVALAAMGLPFLDAPELELLAETCRRLRRFDFLLTCAPLRIVGGTGSPVNPICYF